MNVPQPLTVVTDWGNPAIAPVAALLIGVGAAGLVYWRVLQRDKVAPLGVMLPVAAIALTAAWLSPVLFSSDVYAYAAYGEMARIGLNPYAPLPDGITDTVIRAAQIQWISAFPICVYGLAFVEFARLAVALAAPLGMLAQLDTFRVTASLALLICIRLAYSAFPGDPVARLRAAATIGLNPAAIWCAAEGHNDAMALAILLAGILLIRRGRLGIGAALATLSAVVKLPAAAVVAVLGIVDSRARVAACAALAVTLALSLPLMRGAVTHLAAHGVYAPQASLQAVIAPISPPLAWIFAAGVSTLLVLRGVALLRIGLPEGWIWLGIAAWVLIANPYPWYGIWLVSLAALAPRTPAGTTAIMLSLTSTLRYIPDAVGPPTPSAAVLLGIVATLPLLQLIAVRGRYNERLA